MNRVYLPNVQSGKIRQVRVRVGVDAGLASEATAMTLGEMGVGVATIGNVRWQQYEPQRGVYFPATLKAYDATVKALVYHGVEPMVTVHGAPAWALLDRATGACGPIQARYFANYRNFVRGLLEKWNAVKEFQIWNEQDSPLGAADHFGCWGPAHVQRFVDLMDCVWSLKDDFPHVRFSLGLMMPNDSPAWLEEYMRRGGKADHINLHHYPRWYAGNSLQDADAWYLSSGVPGEKARRVWDLSGLPVWITEANLLKDGASDPVYEEAKTVFMERLCQDVFPAGVTTVIFYAWRSGWRNANIAGLPAEEKLRELAGRKW